MFSLIEGLGAGRVDGLGEAGRVGRLDLASAALSGEILHCVADSSKTLYVSVSFKEI